MKPLRAQAAVSIALMAGLLPLRAAENSLSNAGFESPSVAEEDDLNTVPESWTWFSSLSEKRKIGLTTKQARTGKQAVRLTAQGSAESYQGLFQMLPAASGVPYDFNAYVRNDGANPLTGLARGQLSIEWKDASGQEIDRVWGPDWGASLSATGWSKVEMSARPPANAVTGHFVITQFDGKDDAGSGAFLVDDAGVTKRE